MVNNDFAFKAFMAIALVAIALSLIFNAQNILANAQAWAASLWPFELIAIAALLGVLFFYYQSLKDTRD